MHTDKFFITQSICHYRTIAQQYDTVLLSKIPFLKGLYYKKLPEKLYRTYLPCTCCLRNVGSMLLTLDRCRVPLPSPGPPDWTGRSLPEALDIPRLSEREDIIALETANSYYSLLSL